jgi:anti-repressor protein
MEQIVYKSEKGNLVTSSRLVASKFKREHKSVLRSIDNLECSQDFKERNFALLINKELHPSPIIQEREFIMTRDGFSFLAMGFTGKEAAKFKEDFINAFNQMETALKSELPNFNDPVVAARAWADQVEQKQLAEKKVLYLTPKAEVFDRISDCINLKSVGEVAKLLEYGRNYFFRYLRERKILMADNIPYQTYISRGYFEVKTKPIPGIARDKTTTYFTIKGELWIAELVNTVNYE